jgi:hypothetical protein
MDEGKKTSLAAAVSSTWNMRMTSVFPCIWACDTSARETSNASFAPTLKQSLVPEVERTGKWIKPEVIKREWIECRK